MELTAPVFGEDGSLTPWAKALWANIKKRNVIKLRGILRPPHLQRLFGHAGSLSEKASRHSLANDRLQLAIAVYALNPGA